MLIEKGISKAVNLLKSSHIKLATKRNYKILIYAAELSIANTSWQHLQCVWHEEYLTVAHCEHARALHFTLCR